MSPTLEEMIAEIRDRVVRTETRVVQLGDHVGANLRSKQRIDVEPTAESVVVYIDALDVSISRIHAEIRHSPHWALVRPGTHCVQIRIGERRDYSVVGEVRLTATMAVDRSRA